MGVVPTGRGVQDVLVVEVHRVYETAGVLHKTDALLRWSHVQESGTNGLVPLRNKVVVLVHGHGRERILEQNQIRIDVEKAESVLQHRAEKGQLPSHFALELVGPVIGERPR